MYDVLDEPLIGLTLDREPHRGSLPDVFAWLSGGQEVQFTALQPHQHHPWHAFLVQLAAIALERGEHDGFPTEPATWRSLLLGLTEGKREPWCLVVDDLSAPALLQPPVPEGTLSNFKTVIPTPDALDILLTTRNFDLKAQRIVHAAPEHWLFALVTKQTFEGYSGKFNYGVARMNGGQANRPCVAVAPSRAWAPRFRRDVRVWLEQRGALIEGYAYDARGAVLLWLIPWDGTKSLPRPSLDPFFIEICRRIRLTHSTAIAARMSTSQIARIDATDHAGDTGDIWTPTQKSNKKSGNASLTVPASGFNYRKLADLLFGDDWHPAPAQKLRNEDSPAPVVIAQALVRGQGKTEGYHERIVPIPGKARRIFASADGPAQLGERAKIRSNRVGEVSHSLLKPAILTLFQGVRDKKLDLRDTRADPWIDRFETRVDDIFFEELFHAVELSDEPARRAWDHSLDLLARRTLREALDEAPLPSAQRYSLLAAAEGRFFGTRKRVFEEFLAPVGEESATHAETPTEDSEPTHGT